MLFVIRFVSANSIVSDKLRQRDSVMRQSYPCDGGIETTLLSMRWQYLCDSVISVTAIRV